jgi:hypothetical protein
VVRHLVLEHLLNSSLGRPGGRGATALARRRVEAENARALVLDLAEDQLQQLPERLGLLHPLGAVEDVEFSLLHIGATKLRTSEIGVVEPSFLEVGSGEPCTSQVSADERCTAELGSDELRVLEVRTVERRAIELRQGEVRAPEVGTAEVRALEVDRTEVKRPSELGGVGGGRGLSTPPVHPPQE